MEYIISDLRADDLKTVSRMEENIGVVLVRMNVNLILSKYIWQQPKDFQRTLIYSCNRQIPTNTLHDLLVTIFRHNVEELAMDLYCVFGDRVLEQVYRVLDEGLRMDETKSDTWMEILMIRPSLLIINIRKIPLKSLRFKLFLRIDLHTDNLLETVGKDVWETIYRDLSEEGCEEELKFQLSLKFFIVIFSCNRRFTDDFVRDVITPVYRKMEKINYLLMSGGKSEICFQKLKIVVLGISA